VHRRSRASADARLETDMSTPFDADHSAAGHSLNAADRLEILKLQALWTAVVRAGRPDRAAELCADDVVVLPPDAAPITGREAARAWLGGLNGGAVERIEVQGVDMRGGPKSAWLTAEVTTVRVRADGGRSTEREKRLWALVKDGSNWRVQLAGWEQADRGVEAPVEIPSPVLERPISGGPARRESTKVSWNPFGRRD
jgi:ketosteroid isomerase-like protein